MVTTWCLRPAEASTVPRIAALSLSVPQLVNTISEGSQLSSAATCSRARSTCFLTCPPKVCIEEALP